MVILGAAEVNCIKQRGVSVIKSTLSGINEHNNGKTVNKVV